MKAELIDPKEDPLEFLTVEIHLHGGYAFLRCSIPYAVSGRHIKMMEDAMRIGLVVQEVLQEQYGIRKREIEAGHDRTGTDS